MGAQGSEEARLACILKEELLFHKMLTMQLLQDVKAISLSQHTAYGVG